MIIETPFEIKAKKAPQNLIVGILILFVSFFFLVEAISSNEYHKLIFSALGLLTAYVTLKDYGQYQSDEPVMILDEEGIKFRSGLLEWKDLSDFQLSYSKRVYLRFSVNGKKRSFEVSGLEELSPEKTLKIVKAFKEKFDYK